MGFWILPIILVCTSTYSASLAFLYDSLFERRFAKYGHRLYLLAIILFLCVGLIYTPPKTSLLRAAIWIAANFFIIALFRGNFTVRLCIATLYFLILTALEIIFLPIILQFADASTHQIWQNPIVAILSYNLPVAISVIFSLFLAKIFRKWKKPIELPMPEWIAIFLFAPFTFAELYFASILTTTKNDFRPLAPILGFVPFFMSAGMLLLLNKLALSHRIAQENLTLQEQMRYNLLSIQASTENYETQRSLTHDFDNHLLTIVQLLQSKQHKEALNYAQTVTANLSKADTAVSTNNPIADAVLNQKYRKAQEIGVQMQFLVSDLSSFPLSTDEMVTILANLLDNALEACIQDTSTRKKSIRVKLLMEPALATLSIQNTSLPVTVFQNAEVFTTKQEKSEHGYGLKTCKKILQRCGFEFAVQYKSGWFQFTAIKAL